MPDLPPTAGLTDEIARRSTVHSNVAQEVIVTTKDKIELCLIHHQQELESQKDWILPLGILVPVMLTLLTTEFKAGFGLGAPVWQAIFVLTGLGTAIWFARSLARAINFWWNRKTSGISAIIQELKTPINPPS